MYPRIHYPMNQEATPSSFLSAAAATAVSGVPLMLIDDDDAVREIASKILARAEFDVTTAEQGEKALEILRSNPKEFSVILLDLSMPRMDGEDVYREIRALRPHQRVVIMTGYGEYETARRFEGQGVAGYLSKPFTAHLLLAKVREVVATSPLT